MTGPLVSELTSAGIPASSQSVFAGGAIFGAGAQRVMPDIIMDDTYSHLSGISMIAPSPDWFAGIHDVKPMTGGSWWSSFEINMFPMDAGTEQGNTYSGDNLAEDPLQGIMEIEVNTAPSTDVFLNAAGDNVIYVAKLSCVQKDAGSVDPSDDEDDGFFGRLFRLIFFCVS